MIKVAVTKNGIKVSGDKTLFISSKMGYELATTGNGVAILTANGKRCVITEGDTVNGKPYFDAEATINTIAKVTNSLF